MAEIKMVVVNGVRYRPEHAPKETKQADADTAEANHKMRTPRKAAAKSDSKK